MCIALTVKMEMNCRSDRRLSPGSAPTWRITVDIRHLGMVVGYNWNPNTAAAGAKAQNDIIANFIRSVVNTCRHKTKLFWDEGTVLRTVPTL